MKIYVDKIPEGGIELTEKIYPEALLIDTEGIIFVKPVDIKANILKAGAEMFADIALEAPVEYTCNKCLSKFEGVFKKKFNLIREVKPAEIVELDDEIRQEIILDYPMKIVCKVECKGLCPNCGQNLNTGECDCSK
ncbi:MAG: DUF177 domain-containing protein [Candidatus Omnitrophota bacterium]|nr:DUF177 domain-containing protein [Candidatus Omnitrophota bacterium]